MPKRGHAWFPIEWDFGDSHEDGMGGPVPADPLTMYAEEDGDDDNETTVWFSLSGVVETAIESSITDAMIAPDHVASLTKLRDGLADLVAAINKRLPPNSEGNPEDG